jgi:hypothetical protein
MELHFRKSIDQSSGTAEFRVLCGLLHLSKGEERDRANFGMPRLEALFDDPDWLAKLRTPNGIMQSFPEVNDALAFIAQVRGACQATEADWQAANAFPGDEAYP